jgi:hypothetical protein
MPAAATAASMYIRILDIITLRLISAGALPRHHAYGNAGPREAFGVCWSFLTALDSHQSPLLALAANEIVLGEFSVTLSKVRV